MTLQSMTGYAYVEGKIDIIPSGKTLVWNWELKSVNARGLDLRFRLPNGFEGLEQKCRRLLTDSFSRGTITVHLNMPHQQDAVAPIINTKLLDGLLNLQNELEAKGLVFPSPPRLDVLLTIRGIVEFKNNFELNQSEKQEIDETLISSFRESIRELTENRADEGGRIYVVLNETVLLMEKLRDKAIESAESHPDIRRQRINNQVEEILAGDRRIDEERLIQELAFILSKSDVKEEIDRLESHLKACRALLESGNKVGRRLDFLCQELNREANTVCAKSLDLALTNIAIEFKSKIEQFREQIQNVE